MNLQNEDFLSNQMVEDDALSALGLLFMSIREIGNILPADDFQNYCVPLEIRKSPEVRASATKHKLKNGNTWRKSRK